MELVNPDLRLILDIETSHENGEDYHLICDDSALEYITLGVFDGLGGRSAGFDGMTGGRIASRKAAYITKRTLRQWQGQLSQDVANSIQVEVCQDLRSEADLKMEKSRLSGTLTGKRLCTTIALANIPKKIINSANLDYEVRLAWMGDSRIYFLSPTKGLQQLTKDDLEINKNAFQMIREDPPMSQYLTADIPETWKMHFAVETFEERGCILACTDGCFQYLPSPWDFERLLLESLLATNTLEQWQKLLAEKYYEIRQDDISLILFPIAFPSFFSLKKEYQRRLTYIKEEYGSNAKEQLLTKLWEKYKFCYEERLKESRGSQIELKQVQEYQDTNDKENTRKRQGSALISLDVEFQDKNINSEKNTVEKIKQVRDFLNEHQDKNDASQASRFLLLCNELLDTGIGNRYPKIYFLKGKLCFLLCEFQETIHSLMDFASNFRYEDDIDIHKEYLNLMASAYYEMDQFMSSAHYFSDFKNVFNCDSMTSRQLIHYAYSLLSIREHDDALSVCRLILERRDDISDPDIVCYANYFKCIILAESNKSEDLLEAEKALQLFIRESSQKPKEITDELHSKYKDVKLKIKKLKLL